MTVLDRTVQESDARIGLQFGLREMFALTTLTAIALGLLALAPNIVAGSAILILSVSIPVALTTVLIYGRGFQRTFCIGALIPTGGVYLSFSFAFVIFLLQPGPSPGPNTLIEMTDQVGEQGRGFAAALWGLAFILGIVAVTVRLLVERYRTQGFGKSR